MTYYSMERGICDAGGILAPPCQLSRGFEALVLENGRCGAARYDN